MRISRTDIKYLSVCSGIEAATVAWEPLGFKPWAFSEIEAFPSAVLSHHYPNVPNLGDMTKFKEWPDAAINVLVGGTPCQSFSLAGLRRGLDDPRGNLMLTYLAIADRYRPEWVAWENVPGVLSSNEGRDFGTFLGGLGELGYGFAYRVLDAQYVRVESHPRAVPQRRRRVFVVGHLGDWRRAAAVLFERQSLSGDSAPGRKTGQRVAPTVTSGPPFSRTGDERVESEVIVTQPFDVGNCLSARMYKGINTTLDEGQTPIISFHNRQDPAYTENISQPIGAKDNGLAIAFAQNTRDELRLVGGDGSISGALAAEPGMKQQTYIATGVDEECNASIEHYGPLLRGGQGGTRQSVMTPNLSIRRLTPIECERLQGFPDNYTRISWRGKAAEQCPDGPRYKALGNSMAVNVMRWIGERIMAVNALKYLQSDNDEKKIA